MTQCVSQTGARILGAALAITSLTTAATAQANRWRTEVQAAVTRQVDSLVGAGYEIESAELLSLKANPVVGTAKARERLSIELRLSGGVQYTFFSTCDTDCRELELQVRRYGGGDIGYQSGKRLLVKATPPRSGTYVLNLTITEPARGTSYIGLAILSARHSQLAALKVSGAAVGAVLLLLPLALTLQRKQGPILEKDQNVALQLPEALRHVKVFRREYDVWSRSGIVYDKEVWTETSVTTTTTGGSRTGDTYSAPTTSTSVQSTVHHKYWIRDASGQESWSTFSDNALSAAKGQVLTLISSGNTLLLAHNHGTGQTASEPRWLEPLHRVPLGRLFAINVGAWLAGYVALLQVPGAKSLIEGSAVGIDGGWVVVTLGALLIGGIYLGVIVGTVKGLRDRGFRLMIVPPLRAFLQESTRELERRFVGTQGQA